MDVATDIVVGVGSIILTLVGVIVRDVRSRITVLENAILGENGIRVQIARILERDRRKRVTDYENEPGPNWP